MRIVQHEFPIGIRFPIPLYSDAGLQILKRMEAVEEHLRLPASAYGEAWKIEADIHRVASEARCDNWDDEGSAAVNGETAELAAQFASVLPAGFPLPEVEAGRRGEIMFEWHTGKRSAVVVSVYPDRSIGYAVVRGQARAHGREPFQGTVPDVVVLHLRSMLH